MFGIAGVMAVLSSANAVTEEECNRSSKMFWVKYTRECVPINVCDSKFKGKYDNDYCVREFKDVETPDWGTATDVAEQYLMIDGIDHVVCANDQTGKEYSLLGQNFIACTTADGRYFVFEFDDTTNTEIGDEHWEEMYEVVNIFCTALGGQSLGTTRCVNIDKDKCAKLEGHLKRVEEKFSTYFDDDGYCQINEE